MDAEGRVGWVEGVASSEGKGTPAVRWGGTLGAGERREGNGMTLEGVFDRTTAEGVGVLGGEEEGVAWRYGHAVPFLQKPDK